MRRNTTGMIVLMTLAIGVLIGWAVGQDQPQKKDGPAKYKMTTEIPSSVPCPNKLETRFGTLNFFDGFPDKASTEKLYDNLDFQHAMQGICLAYLL